MLKLDSHAIQRTSILTSEFLAINNNRILTSLYVQRRFQATTASLAALKNDILVQFDSNDTKVPPLKLRWFFATDVPITMPDEYSYTKTEIPKKFSPFSDLDSRNLERAYQKILSKNNSSTNGVSTKEKADDKDHLVPVNEDHLFEVDLIKRSMRPVYWEGAVYEVRRGTWFDDKGFPLTEDLSKEIERGYLKLRPFDKKETSKTSSKKKSKQIKPKTNDKNPLNKSIEKNTKDNEESNNSDYLTYDLKGFKEGKVVVFGEENVAYIVEEFADNAALQFFKSFVKGPALTVSRGFNKSVERNNKISTDPSKDDSISTIFELELSQLFGEKTGFTNNSKDEERTKKAMEYEVEEDYKNGDQNQKESKDSLRGDREIDHLILCIHGIGQALGTKFQGVNFVHTINILRQNIKKVYQENSDLKSLLNNDPNCRIQVLPITWRHKVDFKSDKPSLDEDHDDGDEVRLPSLLDITVDEIKPLRNLLGSVVLDVLLYYEPKYLDQILNEVTRQANEIYRVFKERNPKFNGKVSIIGHSLGSAIGFDLLSLQPDVIPDKITDPKVLSFPVHNYFAIGSPVGVFNLLKRKNIGARSLASPKDDPTKISRPLCGNLYNVFHPCDPVGYRMEPLISPEFKDFQAESIPFLIEDFNKQLSTFATFKDKMISGASEAWNKVTSGVISSYGSLDVSKLSLLTSKNDKPKIEATKETTNKKLVQPKSTVEDAKKAKTYTLTEKQLKKLGSLNYHGRVDYALQQGLFDLSIVSAISAHVSYFEDENTAAFIVKETFTEGEVVKEKEVSLLENSTS